MPACARPRPTRGSLLVVTGVATLIGIALAIGGGITWRLQLRADDGFRSVAVPVNGTVITVLSRFRSGNPGLVEVSYRVGAQDRRGELDLGSAKERRYEADAQVPLLVDPAHPNTPRLPEQAAGAIARDNRNMLIEGLIMATIAISVHLITRYGTDD